MRHLNHSLGRFSSATGIRCLLLGFFLFHLHFINAVYAQTSGHERFQIFAPNTYELGKFGDIPVDISTGVPQINIPLFSLSDRDINLDISLSYHASGIKVDQEAGWTGLGWTFNVGGVITREIRGNADDFDQWGNFKTRTDVPDYVNGTYAAYYNQVSGLLDFAAAGGTDNGADIFYYNFNGRAGKFFLDNQAKGVTTKYEDLKIEFIHVSIPNGSRPHFVITDELGIKYEFKDLEITQPPGGANSYISGWYLSRIVSPSGGEISFEYQDGGLSTYNYQRRCHDKAFFPVNTLNSNHPIPVMYTETCINYNTRIGGIVPKKISTSSGNYVDLITSTIARLDSDPSLSPTTINNQLNAIVLKNVNNEQVKRFNFSYSYFEANDSRKFPATSSNDVRKFLNYRLRLDSVQEVSTLGALQSAHRFEYYGDNNPYTDDEYTLPYRLSPSQDHWGFYNYSYNTTIFPSNPVSTPFRKDEWFERYSGAFGASAGFSVTTGSTREPNAEALKAGMLKKIIFPTGGYTKFEFEAHHLTGPGNPIHPLMGGVRIKQVESKSDALSLSVFKNYDYIDHSIVDYNKCLYLENPYYTWYYNKDYPSAGMDLMTAFGVPYSMASAYEYVGMADASPQLMLGSGMHPVYRSVRESAPGNGSILYNYDVNDEDNQEYSHNNGVQLPGLFYSALISDIPGFSVYHITDQTMPCSFPFPNFLNNDWRRGQLLTREVYDENNLLVVQDSIIYDVRSVKAIPGYKVSKLDAVTYLYARYYNVGGYIKPIKEVTRTYGSNGSYVRSVKELEYNSIHHKQLSQTNHYTSTGDVVKTEYYYPSEYGSTLSTLDTKHIIKPVDVRVYKNGKLISGDQIQYGDNGLPLAVYRAESGGTDIPFNSLNPYSFAWKRSNYFNSDNSLRSQLESHGPSTVFLWSYQGRHPVAQIYNASYDEVKAALNDASETFINALRNKVEPNGTDLNILNGLRTNPILKNAFIDTYTYSPLIGMMSQTDPKGVTTYYEYDNFWRLENIKDHNEDIIKNYKYNYKP